MHNQLLFLRRRNWWQEVEEWALYTELLNWSNPKRVATFKGNVFSMKLNNWVLGSQEGGSAIDGTAQESSSYSIEPQWRFLHQQVQNDHLSGVLLHGNDVHFPSGLRTGEDEQDPESTSSTLNQLLSATKAAEFSPFFESLGSMCLKSMNEFGLSDTKFASISSSFGDEDNTMDCSSAGKKVSVASANCEFVNPAMFCFMGLPQVRQVNVKSTTRTGGDRALVTKKKDLVDKLADLYYKNNMLALRQWNYPNSGSVQCRQFSQVKVATEKIATRFEQDMGNLLSSGQEQNRKTNLPSTESEKFKQFIGVKWSEFPVNVIEQTGSWSKKKEITRFWEPSYRYRESRKEATKWSLQHPSKQECAKDGESKGSKSCTYTKRCRPKTHTPISMSFWG